MPFRDEDVIGHAPDTPPLYCAVGLGIDFYSVWSGGKMDSLGPIWIDSICRLGLSSMMALVELLRKISLPNESRPEVEMLRQFQNVMKITIYPKEGRVRGSGRSADSAC